MNINIKNLKPNQVSYNWNKQTIAIFGNVKSGKSTFMFDLLGQDALFVATEDGHDAIPGIISQRVYSVADIKEIIWQIQDLVEINECPFKSVVFDTVDNLEVMIQKYVCTQAGVQNMGDIGHGKLYMEFDKVLNGIINDLKACQIGIHFVGHVKQKKVEDKINKVEYEKFVPSVSERMQKIILSDAYFMPFIFNKLDENQQEHRMMAFRDTTQWLSGCRYKHMVPFTLLNVEAFKKSVEDAIKKEEELKAGSTTTESKVENKKELDFKSIMARGSELGVKFQQAGQIEKLMDAVTEVLGTDENGKPRMFNQLKESQSEVANMLVMKLERLAKELGIN